MHNSMLHSRRTGNRVVSKWPRGETLTESYFFTNFSDGYGCKLFWLPRPNPSFVELSVAEGKYGLDAVPLWGLGCDSQASVDWHGGDV